MATGSKRQRKDKDGKVIGYQLTVDCGTDPVTGERVRHYKTVKGSKKEAEVALRKFIEEVENGGILTVSSIKFSDWLYEWLDLYLPNIEATTRAGYKERIKTCIIPTLGHIPINTLKTTHIQLWVNDMRFKKGLSPKTIKNAFLNIKASLDKAVILKMIPYNPCIGVELPKLQKPKITIYNSDEITDILNLAVGTDIFLIILLAVSLGLRRGELMALKWEDIDFENKIVHIHRNTTMAEGIKISKAPKSTAGIRDITIGDNLVRILRIAYDEYLDNKKRWGYGFKDNDLIISKPNGESFRPDSITQKWERFVDDNKLKKVSLHGLRHSCATAMVAAGVDLKTIQTRMGHSDISTTMNIYAHSTKAMDNAAAVAMDNVLFSNTCF